MKPKKTISFRVRLTEQQHEKLKKMKMKTVSEAVRVCIEAYKNDD